MKARFVIVTLLVATSGLTAQVNRNVWVSSAAAVFEVSPTGAVVGNYPTICTSSVGPCQFRTARDGLGNVYLASLAFYAPGVGGSIRTFRTGLGSTALLGGGTADIVVDGGGDLWWIQPNYSAAAQSIVSSTIYRGPAPLAGASGNLQVPGPTGRLAAHPTSGVWASDGLFIYRVQVGAGGLPAPTASLSLPGIATMAADGLGRLWAWQASSSQLLRVAENPPGVLAVVWTQTLASVEAILVDRTNTVLVHAIAPVNVSDLHRFGPDGTFVSVTHFPLRLRTVDVDTRLGLWGQVASSGSGVGLAHLDAAGNLGLTPLGPLGTAFDTFTTGGDTTGSIFARLGPPGIDSDGDGDGAPNRGEVTRGADPFDSTSRPPVLVPALLAGAVPPTYTLAYSDPDPSHAGFGYVIGCSLSATAGLAVGPYGANPIEPLDADFLLHASITLGAPTFIGFTGYLTSSGQATGYLALPPGTPTGVTLYLSGITFSPATGLFLSTADAATILTP